jgi:D-glycero-D-manno-heptose 1,7-bisphosphate phosphatase
MARAVFLDRDGVINQNRDDYVRRWDEFVFWPGALDALRRLAQTPLLIIVVTNQSIINRGLASLQEVQDICRRMVEEIQNNGGRIDGVLMCPHRPDEGCNCRKPRPGLLLEAADLYHLDLPQSYLIGDAMSDVEAGLSAGCRVLLVKTGLWNRQRVSQSMANVPMVQDLTEAAEWVIAQEQSV